MAWSLIAHTVKVKATTTAINTTGADIIVVLVSSYSTTPITVSDSQSNTWTGLTEKASGNDHLRLFYCQAPTTNASHTFSTNADFYTIAVEAWSGSTSTPFDVQNGAITASGNTLATGSITPSVDNELIVAGIGQTADGATAGATYSIDSSFTISDQNLAVGGSNTGIGMAYLAQGTAAAVNPTWTLSLNPHPLAAVIASFKPAAGGGGLNITPGQGTLKLTGQAPTVSKTANWFTSPSAGAMVITGFAPRVLNSSLNVSATPGAGALKFTGFAPSISITAGKTITPQPGALVISGKAPTVGQTANWFTRPAAGSIVITGFAPSVSVQAPSPIIVPGAAALILTAFAPTVVNSGDVTTPEVTIRGGKGDNDRRRPGYYKPTGIVERHVARPTIDERVEQAKEIEREISREVSAPPVEVTGTDSREPPALFDLVSMQGEIHERGKRARSKAESARLKAISDDDEEVISVLMSLGAL